MVEVSVLFVVLKDNIDKLKSVNCASIYLIEKNSRYSILTERILKCQSFKEKIDEMIDKTPFNINRIFYTFGMSAIAVLDTNIPFKRVFNNKTMKNWYLFNPKEVNDKIDINDINTIRNFLEILNNGKYFEHQK